MNGGERGGCFVSLKNNISLHLPVEDNIQQDVL